MKGIIARTPPMKLGFESDALGSSKFRIATRSRDNTTKSPKESSSQVILQCSDGVTINAYVLDIPRGYLRTVQHYASLHVSHRTRTPQLVQVEMAEGRNICGDDQFDPVLHLKS